MATRKWGNCRDCRFFASHSTQPRDDEQARCTHPELSRFELQVSGASGCNAFELRQPISAPAEQPAPAP